MPEDAINEAASKLAGAVAPLNTIESLAGSKPVIVEFPSRPITFYPLTSTSYTTTSDAAVAATLLLFS